MISILLKSHETYLHVYLVLKKKLLVGNKWYQQSGPCSYSCVFLLLFLASLGRKFRGLSHLATAIFTEGITTSIYFLKILTL